jgi:hypothetical protein
MRMTHAVRRRMRVHLSKTVYICSGKRIGMKEADSVLTTGMKRTPKMTGMCSTNLSGYEGGSFVNAALGHGPVYQM